MKNLITLIVLLLIAQISMAGERGMKQFYAQHRHDTNVEHITIPKFLMRLSADDKEARQIIKFMRSLKIFQMEGLKDNRYAVNAELKNALENDGFESMLNVSESDENINIYVLQDRRYIRKVLITIDSKEELLVLQTKTKISFDKLSAMIADYSTGKDKKSIKGLFKS